MPYVHMGDIVPYNETKDHSDILLVFGGSSNHIVTVLSGILSFVYHFPYSPLLFVDFGATKEEVCWLKYVFTMVHQYHDAMSMSIPIYYRIYDWEHFPDWMHITKALNHGGYTWKPIAIADAFFQWKGAIMWNDAGNYYGNGCLGGIQLMRKEGVYMPYDPTNYTRFHNDSYTFLVDNGLIKSFNRTYVRSGRAIYMLFDYRNDVCRERLMIPWVQCAFTRKCMTLKGVWKNKHLPEQGVLSALMHHNNITLSCDPILDFNPIRWRDNYKDSSIIPNRFLQGEMEAYSARIGRNYSQELLQQLCVNEEHKNHSSNSP